MKLSIVLLSLLYLAVALPPKEIFPEIIENENPNTARFNRMAAKGLMTMPPTTSATAQPMTFEAKTIVERDTGITVSQNPIFFSTFTHINEEVIYGVDTFRRVWLSTDSMMTWAQQTTITDNIRTIYSNRVDNSTAFFLGTGNYSWVTYDLGKTYTRINMNRAIDQVLFHPTKKSTLMGTRGLSLYVSNDMADSWSIVRDRLYYATWCHAGSDGVPENRLCMITDVAPEELGLPDDTNSPLVGYSRFIRSEDFGNTISVMMPYECSYLVTHRLYFYAVCFDPEAGRDDLFVSGNHGNTFHKTQFPRGKEVPYLTPSQLLDDSTGAIWLAINHEEYQWGAPHFGNVYTSDGYGHTFTESLAHVVYLNNIWDFDRVHSLEGVYIANTLVSWQFDNEVLSDTAQIRTHLTIDNGESWDVLTPPSVDSNGNAISCTGPCSLNLFGVTTWLGIGGHGVYGDFWSTRQALGLIMATGNVADYLQFEEENVNTYMSRDGGQSWIEVAKGAHVYEFGDHGGILIMVNNQIPTTTFQYSTDEGQTWSNFTFSTSPVSVTNVFTTSSAREKFVIFGLVNASVIYYGVDFSQFREQDCGDGDFETWSMNKNCVLGRNTVYNRRKRAAQCFVPDHYPQIKSVTNCNCTESDYECDFGYYQVMNSDECVMSSLGQSEIEQDILDQCADPDNAMTYLESKGKRLVPGDSCQNLLAKYTPEVKQCPVSGESSHGTTFNIPVKLSSGIIALMIIGSILILISTLMLGLVLGAKSERLKAWLAKEDRTKGNRYANVFENDDDPEPINHVADTNFKLVDDD